MKEGGDEDEEDAPFAPSLAEKGLVLFWAEVWLVKELFDFVYLDLPSSNCAVMRVT